MRETADVGNELAGLDLFRYLVKLQIEVRIDRVIG